MKDYEILIVGGGPAGLSAALVLGRCRRNIIVCDTANYRNKFSYAMYGYLSRDGISPLKFSRINLKQLSRYPNIELLNLEVTSIEGQDGHFVVNAEHVSFKTKKIILATGIKDIIPHLPGIMKFFGKSVFLCPYCDGWEFRDKPIAVYGLGDNGPSFALLLRKWSSDIILCNEGIAGGSQEENHRLKELGIRVVTEKILSLKGKFGQLEKILLSNKESISVKGLFFNTPILPNSSLAKELGCQIDERDQVVVNEYGLTSVAGIYAIGDVVCDLKLAIMAAGHGAKTAYYLNKELLKEEALIV